MANRNTKPARQVCRWLRLRRRLRLPQPRGEVAGAEEAEEGSPAQAEN
jgi:hypothetical protein